MFQINSTLFDKYAHFDFKENTSGRLFGIDLLDAVVKHVCPYCGNKLKMMASKPFAYCSNPKKHKKSFIISKSKLK